MASYVDEKIAKVTLDNKAFTKNAADTMSALEKLKMAFRKVSDGKSANNVSKEMGDMTNAVSKSVQKSESLLSKLKGIFSKSTKGIDMSQATVSIDKMNTDIANKTARTSDILSRLKGIFQKADSGADFQNSIASIDKLNAKIAGVDAGPIASAFQSVSVQVQNSISAMDIALGNMMANMAQKAIGFGKQFLSGPMDGYGEYMDKLGSVQTILSNTKHAGTGIGDVTKTLSELNTYADQTIYSFADMTRNIGTFTAAGVGLDESATAIKGISNLAAASGSNTQQASTAMYQLSQALAAGRVSLMDWNSVVNAGMGGKLFQDALTETAKKLGTAKDESKSFRDSLQDGWLTTDVLLQTLDQFSKDQSMLDAATKVKTFSQLVDTAKEAIGSGWAESWEHVFGDFEEAKELWTGVNDIIDKVIGDSQGSKMVDGMKVPLGNFRNEMLKTWKAAGGFKQLSAGLISTVKGFSSMFTSYRAGFRSVMGDYETQAKALLKVSSAFKTFGENLAKNQTLFNAFKVSGTLVANVFKTLGSVVGNVFSGFKSQAGGLQSVVVGFTNMARGISSFFESIRSNSNIMTGFTNIGTALGNVFSTITSIITIAVNVVMKFFSAFNIGSGTGSGFLTFTEILVKVTGKIKDFVKGIEDGVSRMESFKAFGTIASSIFSGIGELIGDFLTGVLNVPKTLMNAFGSAESALKSFGKFFQGVLENIGRLLGPIGEALKEFFEGFRAKDLVNGALSAGLIMFVKQLKKLKDVLKEIFQKKSFTFLEDIKEAFEGPLEKAGEVLENFGGSVSAFTGMINVVSLTLIAASILALTLSIKELSKLEMDDLSKGLIGMGASMFTMVKSFQALAKFAMGVPKGTASTLIAFAVSVKILASAMKDLSNIPAEEMLKTIVALGSASAILVASFVTISRTGGEATKGAALMVSLAVSIKIMASAMKDIAKIDWNGIAKSLASIVVLLTTMTVAARLMNGVQIKMSAMAGLLTMATTLKSLAKTMSTLADMPWGKMLLALGTIEVLIASLVMANKSLSKNPPSPTGVLSYISMAVSLKILAKAIKELGDMDPNSMLTGITGMGMVILEFWGMLKVVDKINPSISGIASLVVASGSLAVLAKSIKSLSDLDPNSMMVGLIAMSGVVIQLSVTLKVIDKLNPSLGSIWALLGAAGALASVGQALKMVAGLGWGEITQGLYGLAGSMAIMLVAVKMINKIPMTAGDQLGMLTLSLMGIAGAVKLLSTISWASATTGLFALASNLAILLGAAKLAPLVAPGLSMLSSTLLSFGASALMASASLALGGMGIMAFGIGLGEIARSLPSLVQAIILSIDGLAQLVITKGPLMQQTGVLLVKLFLEGLTVLIPEIVNTGLKIIEGLLIGLAENVPRIMDAGVLLITELAKSLIDNMGILVTTAIEVATSFIQHLSTALIQMKGELIPALTELFSVISEIILTVLGNLAGPVLAKMVEIFTPVKDFIISFFGELAVAIEPILTPIADMFKTLFENLPAILTPIAQTLISLFENIGSVVSTVGGVINNAIQGIVTVFQIMGTTIQVVAMSIVAAINGIANVISSVFNGISSVIQSVGSVIESVGKSIQSVLEGVGSVVESVGKSIQSVFEGMGSVIESVGSSIKSVLDGIKGVIESVGKSAKDAGTGFDRLADGVVKITNTKLGDMTASLGAVADAVRKISKSAEGMETVSGKLGQVVSALSGLSTVSAAVPALNMVVQSLERLALTATTLPQSMTGLATAFNMLGANLMTISSGMQMFVMQITMLGGVVMTVSTGVSAMAMAMTMLSGVVSISAAGMTTFATVVTSLSGVLGSVATAMTSLTSGIVSLGTSLMTATASMAAFGTTIMGIVATLSAFGMGVMTISTAMMTVTAGITMLNGTLIMLGGALTTSVAGLTIFGTGLVTVSGSLTIMTGGLTLLTSGLSSLGSAASSTASAFSSLSSAASSVSSSFTSMSASVNSAMNSIRSTATSSMQSVVSAIRSSMSQAQSSVQQSMNSMANSVRSSGQQMASAGQQAGQQTGRNIAQGIQSNIGAVNSAMQGIVNAVHSAGGAAQAGGSYVGSMISQGVANGIWAHLGSVIAATNAIVEQANRAARAKAEIRSPSRLFAKSVGRYIPEGVAMGVRKFTHKAVDAVVNTVDKMSEGAVRGISGLGNTMADEADKAKNLVNSKLLGDIDDWNYHPTITPVVNSAELDAFNRTTAQIKMGTHSRGISYSPYGVGGIPTSSSVSNSSTYENTYHVAFNVEGGIDESKIPELARKFERELQRIDERNRDARGGLY